MRSKRPFHTRAGVAAAALVSAAALVTALAPEAAANPSALPLPVPAPESLITEGVTIEGPLINNLGLPTLK